MICQAGTAKPLMPHAQGMCTQSEVAHKALVDCCQQNMIASTLGILTRQGGAVIGGTTSPVTLRLSAYNRQGLGMQQTVTEVLAAQKPTLNLRKWSAKFCTLM